MNKEENDKLISKLLQDWFEINKRNLPWRHTKDPYKVWISEVILQQTRVVQGYDYFLRFVNRFPDVRSLARASEQEVLKLWQGLGYYSRARNLHAAAIQIVEKFGGEFPSSYREILSLKGVGPYTAAAVASIVYGLPCAAVDGNVYRVLSRLFAIETPIDTSAGQKCFAQIAQTLLNEENPGDHNQAIMELGAVICTPSCPNCGECPLQSVCLAYEKKNPDRFPVKGGKRAKKERFFHYFHIEQKGFTYIQKRGASDIWKNLYEFPLIETETPADLSQLFRNERFASMFRSVKQASFSRQVQFKHVLSHRIVHASFYRVIPIGNAFFDLDGEFIRIETASLSDYPVSRLIHKYLEIFSKTPSPGNETDFLFKNLQNPK